MLVDRVRPILAPILGLLPQPALEVSHLDFHPQGLPPSLDSFTIAHISDLHVGEKNWGPLDVDKAVHAIAQVGPDLIVNTGDFIRRRPPIERVIDIAGRFVLPGIPNVAVLGNHDYYAGEDYAAQLTESLEEAGITMLTVVRPFVDIRSDMRVAGPQLLSETKGADQGQLNGVFNLALVHEPDRTNELRPGFGLVLCGHTHGGQISLPLLTPLIVRKFSHSTYIDGFYAANGNQIYVNRGLGCTGLPFRFRASPEVTFIRLTL